MSEPTAPYTAMRPAPTFMPRPIRFRVWGGETMHYPSDEAANGYFLDTDGAVLEYEDYPNDGLWEAEACVAMLSTGLTDAEGREVFEGDIVTDDWPESRPAVVAWDDAEAGFFADGSVGWPCAFYVVGNVYENPDLL